MCSKILVTYASWTGSTAEVAEAIGQELKAANVTVDVLPIKKATDMSAYKAVVVGMAVRMGKVHSDAVDFLEKHQEVLSQMPVAYFVVCLTMQDDTEENRCKTDTFLSDAREKAPKVKPISIGLFGGRLDFKKISTPMKLVMKARKREEGDFRNWDVIREWAVSIRARLLGE